MISPTPDSTLTLPALAAQVLARVSNSAAFSIREVGYWRKFTSEFFAQEIRRCCLGLIDLGLRPGDSVGILAPSSPHWLIADLAIMSAGGICVPLFPNLSKEHLLFEADNVAMKYLIVIGQAQWELVAPYVSHFHQVIVKDVLNPPHNVMGWSKLLEHGDELSQRDPGLYAATRAKLSPASPATIIHTSGSTGTPKGVVLSHANLVSQVLAASTAFPLLMAKDRALSCLPLAHIFERITVYTYLNQGVAISFADDIKNIGILMREAQPTVMTMVPRLVEKLHARILKQLDAAVSPRRQLGRWAVDKALHDEPAATPHGWTTSLADTLVYRRLRTALGGQLRCLIVGGAALAGDLARFLTNVGVPVYTGYGLTEASPVIASNRPDANKIGTVGKPFPGVEVRISPAGEILARGENIMLGYHGDPAATSAVLDAQGWLHTGDSGHLDEEGYLVITGRLKELYKTSNGKYVSPIPIEQALAGCRLIDQAMVIAEGRPCVGVLLFPDSDTVRQRKEQAGVASMSDEAFLASPTVVSEIEAALAQVNSGLDRWQQVHFFRFAPGPATIGAELTPTMKLRRHVIMQKYAQLIDQMYQAAENSANSER